MGCQVELAEKLGKSQNTISSWEPANIAYYKSHKYGIMFFVWDNFGIIFGHDPAYFCPKMNKKGPSTQK